MERKIFLISTIVLLCSLIVGCNKKDSTIEDIKADSYNISYKDSIIYNSDGRVDKTNVEELVKKYNNIELTGTTADEVNSEKSILITFMYNNQISSEITIYDNGICSFNGNSKKYIISEDSNIYDDALKSYEELISKYKK
jgi:hypothetical protein